MTQQELCAMFDHTLLKAEAKEDDFRRLCSEAKEIGAAMVAVNPYPVALCRKLLEGSNVHVGAAIAFPLGQTTIAMKEEETSLAISDGADEIDYVINIAKAREHDWEYIEEEMRRLCRLCHGQKKIIKVILEICYLTDEEIVEVCRIARKIGVDYVKTSTGFGKSGAAVEAVRLMKTTVGDKVKVKAAGGIRDWPTCKAMIAAGAERIGTSSSLAILEGFKAENKA